MEPFVYEKRARVPMLTIPLLDRQAPDTIAGISVRGSGERQTAGTSCEQVLADASCYHYSLHLKTDDPEDVVPNREQLVHALKFTPEAWTCADQVHGKRIARVSLAERGAGFRAHDTAIAATDGLITAETDVLLTAFFADCVPLFYWDAASGAIGIAHAGWRGTVAGIAGEMVAHMQVAFHSDPANVHVAIGPSIGACCYEVDDRVATALRKQLANVPEPDVCQAVIQQAEAHDDGRYMVDLKQANAAILRRAGVAAAHIHVSRYCTCCDEQLFFSHRRDGERAGRMAAWIGRRKDEH